MKCAKYAPFGATLILFLTVTACFKPIDVSKEHKALAAQKLSYFQDHRTGVCFAELRVRGYYDDAWSIAAVPCTAEVMKLAGE